MTEGESARVLGLTKAIVMIAAKVAWTYRVPFGTLEKLMKEATLEALNRNSGMMPAADVYTMGSHDPMLIRSALKRSRDGSPFSLVPHIENHVTEQVCGKILNTWKAHFFDTERDTPMTLHRPRQGLPTLRRVIEASGENANVGPVKRELVRLGCAKELPHGGLEYVHDQVGSRPAIKIDLEATQTAVIESLESLLAPILDQLARDLR